MDLDDIRAFIEVAEAGGLTGASRRLGVSKSVTSRRLARLEEQMAAQLISRTTRGVSLTEAGAAFKTHAERMLAELDAGREAVRQDGAVTGRLRISASLTFGATHLAPVLAELALRHPGLVVETTYSDRFVDLIGERYDAAIRLGSLPDSSLVARRIAPVLGAVIATPAYLAQHGTPRTPDELRGHAAAGQSGSEVWRFRQGKREISMTPNIRFVADSGQALLAAVLAGVGIARLPTFLCGPAIAEGKLQPLLMDYPLPEAGLYVVRPPPADHAPAKVTALTDLLLEKFGGAPYWDVCYEARHRQAQAPR